MPIFAVSEESDIHSQKSEIPKAKFINTLW